MPHAYIKTQTNMNPSSFRKKTADLTAPDKATLRSRRVRAIESQAGQRGKKIHRDAGISRMAIVSPDRQSSESRQRPLSFSISLFPSLSRSLGLSPLRTARVPCGALRQMYPTSLCELYFTPSHQSTLPTTMAYQEETGKATSHTTLAQSGDR